MFLQVIPLESHLYEGYGQPFIALRFASSEVSPVVYVENDFGDLYLERQDDVELSDALFDQHRAAGLGYAQTSTRLAALRGRLSPETDTRSEAP